MAIEERELQPSWLMRLLVGKENVQPDTRDDTTRYLQLRGVVPFMVAAALVLGLFLGAIIAG